MENKTEQEKYTIGRMRFKHSTLITIWDEEKNESVFDIMSHEVEGGIKEANKIIKKKIKELKEVLKE